MRRWNADTRLIINMQKMKRIFIKSVKTKAKQEGNQIDVNFGSIALFYNSCGEQIIYQLVNEPIISLLT